MTYKKGDPVIITKEYSWGYGPLPKGTLGTYSVNMYPSDFHLIKTDKGLHELLHTFFRPLTLEERATLLIGGTLE